MRNKSFCLAVLLGCLLLGHAQDPVGHRMQSNLTITVKDELGASIGNAFVLVRSDSLERENPTSFTAEFRTNASGQIQKNVAQGFYDVFVASTGFAPFSQKIRARDGKAVTLTVALKVDELMTKEYGDEFLSAPVKTQSPQ